MRADVAQERLDRFRCARQAPVAAPLSSVLGDVVNRLIVAKDAEARTIAAWEHLAPSELRRQSSVVSCSAGLLVIQAANAGVRYELDRFLRTGGERSLARTPGGVIRRVRVVM